MGHGLFTQVKFLSVAVCVAVMVALVILLILVFFQLASLEWLCGYDPDRCRGSRSPCELEGISVIVYGAAGSVPFGCDGCPICLAEYCGGEEVVVLSRCKHMFHRKCISQWIPANSSRCPVCREAVIESGVGLRGRGDGDCPLPFNLASTNFMPSQL